MSKSALLLSVVVLSACGPNVSTRILPREDETISAVSMAGDESTAAAANIEDANSYCAEKEARAIFLDEKVEYQGIFPERGRSAAEIAKRIPVVGDNLVSDEDYRVTTRFRCVPPE